MKTKIILSSILGGMLLIAGCESHSSSTVTGFWSATSIHVNSADVMNSAPYFTNVKMDIQTSNVFIAYSDYDTSTGTWQKTDTQLTVHMPTDTFIYDYTLPHEDHLMMSTTIMGNFSEYEFQK